MPPKINKPIGPISLAQVRKALPLAKSLAKAIDVNKDKAVDLDSEVKRIGVRDQFVARDLMRTAGTYETYNKDMDATPGGMAAQLDRAMRSLEKADNGDGVLTDAELAKASKLARDLARFGKVHAGHSLKDFDVKPYETPGTKEWVKLAAKEYYDVGRSGGGQPRFGTALIIPRAKLPAGVRTEYDKFRKEHPTGKLEASSYLVNGAPAYYVHVKTDTRVDVMVLDPKGKRLTEGVAVPPKVKPGESTWSVPWKLSWS